MADRPDHSTAEATAEDRTEIADNLASLASGSESAPGSRPSPSEARTRDFAEAESALARGDSVGRYMILERVGAGGMGVVYAAWDPDLDRKVALKLLHGDKGKHGQRLLREAQAMARVSHPNVITVHDVGLIGERMFVAMEFVEGQTLGRWAGLSSPGSEEPAPSERSWREIAAVICAAGRGLAAAHELGLIHRDFKPENVMIGDDERVRVMDFGLVRATWGDLRGEGQDPGASSAPVRRPALEDLPQMHTSLDGASALESKLTLDGALLGTPAYMAPEQLRGDAADAWADQFSFCVTAWQCFYGSRPFAGDSPLAVLFSISHAKFREPPPGRKVPGRIRRALERGLASEPADRWPDMAALLAELGRDGADERGRRVGALVSLGLAVAAAATVTLVRPESPPPPCEAAGSAIDELWSSERRAQLERGFADSELVYAEASWPRVEAGLDEWAAQWSAGRRDACEATEVRHEQSPELLDLRMACLDRRLDHFDALLELLLDADPTVIEKAVEAVESLPKLEPCADQAWLSATVRAPEDPELAAAVARLRREVVDVGAMVDAGKGAEALEAAEAAVARARELDWPALIAEAELALGRVHQERAEFEEAVAALERAFFFARRSGHDEPTIRAISFLAYNYTVGLADFEAARRWLDHGEAEAARVGRDELEAEVAAGLGILHYMQGHMAEAAEAFERALELHSGAGSKGTELASAKINLGTVLARVDVEQKQRAFEELEEGLAMLHEAVGPEHPSVAVVLSNLATVHGFLGEHERAIELLEQAVAIHERASGAEHPLTALARINLAINLDSFGDEGGEVDLERVLALARRGRDGLRAAYGEVHPMVAVSERAVGSALTKLGRHREAIERFDRAIEIWTEAVGSSSPDVSATRVIRARALARAGDPSAALEQVEALLAKPSETEQPAIPESTRAAASLLFAELTLDDPARRERCRESFEIARRHYAGVETVAEIEKRIDALERHLADE